MPQFEKKRGNLVNIIFFLNDRKIKKRNEIRQKE